MADHTIMGGKVHVYQRDNSSFWQCSTYLAGKNRLGLDEGKDPSQGKGLRRGLVSRTTRQAPAR